MQKLSCTISQYSSEKQNSTYIQRGTSLLTEASISLEWVGFNLAFVQHRAYQLLRHC